MKLWCYDDAHYWGSTIERAAKLRGVEVKMFDSVRQPDDGFLFFHMHNHPSVRTQHKRMQQHFATSPDLKMVPCYRGAMIYDDKLEQLRQFPNYLPKTHVFRTPTMAREFIETCPALPIISKSSEGGGVRTLRNYDDMRREVKGAFSDLGIKNKYGTRHHSYLYWQTFVGNPEFVIRMVRIGHSWIMLKRGRRVDMERKITPVVNLDNGMKNAFDYGWKFFEEQHLRFGAVDLIPVGDSYNVLKFTASWSLRTFAGSKFPDGRDGTDVADVLLDEMLSGRL